MADEGEKTATTSVFCGILRRMSGTRINPRMSVKDASSSVTNRPKWPSKTLIFELCEKLLQVSMSDQASTSRHDLSRVALAVKPYHCRRLNNDPKHEVQIGSRGRSYISRDAHDPKSDIGEDRRDFSVAAGSTSCQ